MWITPLCAGSALLSARCLSVALLLGSALALSPSSHAGPTTFTYQGQLKDGAALAGGAYDLKFSLWAGPVTPPALLSAGPIEIEDVSVVDGLFTVQLDLGAAFGTFDCSTLWLEVAARPGDSVAAHTVLSPRQEVTPAPQAMFACVAKHLLLPYYESVAMPAPLFELINTGGGKVLRLEVDNAASSANALEVVSNGDSLSQAIFARQDGTGDCGVFEIDNPASSAEALEATSNGTGNTIQAVSTGSGTGLQVTVNGTGRAGYLLNQNEFSSRETLRVQTNANGDDGWPDGVATFSYATDTGGTTYGVWGQVDSGSGYGVFGKASRSAQNTVGIGVYGESHGELGVGVFGASKWTATREGFPNYGVYGVVDSATSGAESAGVYGKNNGTLPISGEFPPVRYGVVGEVLGGGYGVYGKAMAAGASAVRGQSGSSGYAGDFQGRVRIEDGTDASLLGGSGFLVLGPTSSTNIVMDTNEIIARNNGVAAELLLNFGSGDVGIKRNPSGNDLEVEGTASKTTAGDWLANSDRRIKTEIETIDAALATLEKIRLVQFRYTAEYRAAHPDIEDRPYLNVIAQEFRKVFPEWVKESGDELGEIKGILQVDPYPLTIYACAAVQELHRIVDQQAAEIAAQHEEIASLRADKDAAIAALSARLERLETRTAN